MSKTTDKFAPEVRERAVRIVVDHERDYPSREPVQTNRAISDPSARPVNVECHTLPVPPLNLVTAAIIVFNCGFLAKGWRNATRNGGKSGHTVAHFAFRIGSYQSSLIISGPIVSTLVPTASHRFLPARAIRVQLSEQYPFEEILLTATVASDHSDL